VLFRSVTEVGDAYEVGSRSGAKGLQELGLVMEKRYAGPNDNKTSSNCRANLADDWIDIDAEFSSGIQRPLDHPGCRHTTLYRRKEGSGRTLAQTNEAERVRNQLLSKEREGTQARIDALRSEATDAVNELNALIKQHNDLFAQARNAGLESQERRDFISARLPDFDKITESLRAKYTDLRKQADILDENMVSAYRSLLYVSDPSSVGVSFARGVSKALKDTATNGVNEFNRLISRSVINSGTIPVKKTAKGRAFFDPAIQNVVLSAADEGSKTRTFLHEAGHWLESVNEEVRKKVHAFYEKRTEGFPLEHMGGNYPRNEKTRVDHFIHKYMGKDYSYRGERIATEILSMGLEMFYTDPQRLAADDPEYFDFIFDLLRGK